MFDKLFGKKGAKPSPGPATPPADREPTRIMSASDGRPWDGEPDGPYANFACGDLINNLPRLLTIDGRLHAETLLAASGAIAGFAAQRALFASFESQGKPPQAYEMFQAEGANGSHFWFGEILNQTLIAQSDAEAFERLWNLAAGGAVAAGLSPDQAPSLHPMFGHVAGTIGSDREGSTSLENVKFALPAKDLLKAVWPFALQCFNSELSGKAMWKMHSPELPVVVSQRWRPVVAAMAATKFIRDTASVLPPANALTIVIEIGIYASKLDSASIEAKQTGLTPPFS